jgi:hypothetical protein
VDPNGLEGHTEIIDDKEESTDDFDSTSPGVLVKKA